MGGTWGPGIILISVMFVIISIPCIGVITIGYKMIEKLGHFPSKTPAIQKSILVKLIIIELVSLTLLLVFYHMMTDYNKQSQMEFRKNIKVVSIPSISIYYGKDTA